MSIITDDRSAVQRDFTATNASPADTSDFDVLIAEVTRRRDEFDKLTYVPRDIIDMMKKVGIFRSSTPTMFGGEPMPPADFLRILERIAIADGSAAWVAAFGSANTYMASLPIETQRVIYANGPDQVFAGGLYPTAEGAQRARRLPSDGPVALRQRLHGRRLDRRRHRGGRDRQPRWHARDGRAFSRPSPRPPRSRSCRTGTSSACREPAATTPG